jgi:hypothetical protein
VKILYKEVKNKKLKVNGRSADFTSPSFIWGCAGDWKVVNKYYKDTEDLLKECLIFLNKVPNKKYGENYKLASKIEKIIKNE